MVTMHSKTRIQEKILELSAINKEGSPGYGIKKQIEILHWVLKGLG